MVASSNVSVSVYSAYPFPLTSFVGLLGWGKVPFHGDSLAFSYSFTRTSLYFSVVTFAQIPATVDYVTISVTGSLRPAVATSLPNGAGSQLVGVYTTPVIVVPNVIRFKGTATFSTTPRTAVVFFTFVKGAFSSSMVPTLPSTWGPAAQYFEDNLALGSLVYSVDLFTGSGPHVNSCARKDKHVS